MHNDITTIGIDLGDQYSHTCALTPGEEQDEGRVRTNPKAFRAAFSKLRKSQVVMEAGTHSRWACALLRALGHDVVVANPRRVRLIFANHNKNDRFDAEALARLCVADKKLLSPIEHRGEQAHADLSVIKSRDMLVKTRTELINHCRGVAKAHGHRFAKCETSAFHKRADIPVALEPALGPLLAIIAETTQAIKRLDKSIEKTAEACYPDAIRLTAVDGVGALTALTFVLTLDDKSKFPKPRQVGAFLGLVPRRSQSGSKDPQLSITKAGDPYLRRLLVTAAHRILGPFGLDSDLRRFGMKLIERGGRGAKRRAVVAVARKIAVLLARLWLSGRPYVPLGFTNA